MKTIMNLENLSTIDQMRSFLTGSQAIAFAIATSKDERYRFVEGILKRFSYQRLRRADKGVVIQFLGKVSGYSRQQLTHMIQRYAKNGKLKRFQKTLICSGSAICGAAAVLAVEDVLKSEAYKATVAVGTVVLFGTIAMFIYPLLQHAGIFGFTDNQYGIFAGANIHEVAQALVAGTNVSNEAGDVAVIVKMTRVLLLAPVLLFLSFNESRATTNTNQNKTRLTIPWFAIIFVVAIGFNSLHLLPTSIVALINQFDVFLLTMAMAAIGMETNLNKIKKVGFKPLYLATLLFIWLTGAVWLLVKIL